MKVIGLCGGSGSGKGEASRIFSELGFAVIDTDRVYHELTASPSECTAALKKEFGESILTLDGAIDRKKLAALVFSGDGAELRRKKLNEIAHAYILGETRRRIKSYCGKYPAVIVDAPVLYESGFDKECDAVVAVIAEPEVRIERIMARDSIERRLAEERIAAQMSNGELMSRADHTLINNGDLSELRAEASRIADLILK